MLIDPNDFALAVIVAFGLGVALCAIFLLSGVETKEQRLTAGEEKFMAGYAAAKARFEQRKDARGRFVKR